MNLDPARIATREKLILTGIYLSRFGPQGLKRLGFKTYAEAYNVVGYALGSRPSSIKNYRDEFDPLFPNARKGWHKREIRAYCKKVLDEYEGLDLDSFSGLIRSFAGYNDRTWSAAAEDGQDESSSAFAKRLITGLAAERYFESVYSAIPEFQGYAMENTTQLGCGYDFRMLKKQDDAFLAIEVKGLRGQAGSIALTPREHSVATKLRDRFFLFVVKNFQKTPYHEVFPNPLAGRLLFTKTERVSIQISWLTRI
jgi:hypothetical protein